MCFIVLFDILFLACINCWVSFSGFAEAYFEATNGKELDVWAKNFSEQHRKGIVK